jgi:hypothetical protein
MQLTYSPAEFFYDNSFNDYPRFIFKSPGVYVQDVHIATRVVRAEWRPDMIQDLQSLQSIDITAELERTLAEELEKSILEELIQARPVTFSARYIAKNIFNLTDDEIDDNLMHQHVNA